MLDRVVPALRDCSRARPRRDGVVVLHGACLKVGLVDLLGWPPEPPTVAGWTTAAGRARGRAHDGRLRLESYNETARPGRTSPISRPTDRLAKIPRLPAGNGAVAQLVAHLHGMQGVRGSNPLSSTDASSRRVASGRSW